MKKDTLLLLGLVVLGGAFYYYKNRNTIKLRDAEKALYDKALADKKASCEANWVKKASTMKISGDALANAKDMFMKDCLSY